jgi:hypothetical protein
VQLEDFDKLFDAWSHGERFTTSSRFVVEAISGSGWSGERRRGKRGVRARGGIAIGK